MLFAKGTRLKCQTPLQQCLSQELPEMLPGCWLPSIFQPFAQIQHLYSNKTTLSPLIQHVVLVSQQRTHKLILGAFFFNLGNCSDCFQQSTSVLLHHPSIDFAGRPPSPSSGSSEVFLLTAGAGLSWGNMTMSKWYTCHLTAPWPGKTTAVIFVLRLHTLTLS